MAADGISDFRGHPHTASATMLLEVNFVHGPEVNRWICGEFSEFFCVQPGLLDPLRLLEASVCVTESPFDEKVSDIAVHVAGSTVLFSRKPIEADRPIAGPTTQNRPGSCARRPRLSFCRRRSIATDVPTSPRRRVRQSHPFRTFAPSSPQSSVHRLKRWLPDDNSCLEQPEALHATDDRIAPPSSVESRPAAQRSSPLDPQSVFVSCQQIINDYLAMRNYLCRYV
jgi:hypothetical protein